MVRSNIFRPLFEVEKGRHFISFWASKIFEKSGISRIFGLNLVAAMIITGVLSPELSEMTFEHQIASIDPQATTSLEAEPHTETTFELPLANFTISQGFRYYHPGIDLAAPLGTPIYAIEDGIVEYADSSYFGYGNHVIISHDHHMKSLYAHMSEIHTFVGKKVSRGEFIGRVGSTGWSTGNHLHLEIYERGIPINPLEVLPIDTEKVAYDPMYNKTNTSPLPPQIAPPSTETPPLPSTAHNDTLPVTQTVLTILEETQSLTVK